jgi:hypothetical protein
MLSLTLRGENMLLIIDGYKTCLGLVVALIFQMRCINVLVLSPHLSHLLQMFDVCPAFLIKSPLKTNLTSEWEM